MAKLMPGSFSLALKTPTACGICIVKVEIKVVGCILSLKQVLGGAHGCKAISKDILSGATI